jgi:hypothetical protein
MLEVTDVLGQRQLGDAERPIFISVSLEAAAAYLDP